MLNICSSVHDHNQSLIHRGSGWTSQRAKEFILKLKASEENAPEEKRSWRWSHQKLLHQKLKSVDKVQCTKCTSTNSASASATTISASCLYIKTRITVIFSHIVPSVFGMDLKLVLHRTIIKSGKWSMVKNQSFSQDKLMYRLVLNVSQILYK